MHTKDEKAKILEALQMGEALRRGTGRTTRLAHEAVLYVLDTQEPAVLVGFSLDTTKQMVEAAHEKIDGCFQGDNADTAKALVTGCPHDKRQSLRGRSPACRVFEDHFVTMKRAIEAIEALK